MDVQRLGTERILRRSRPSAPHIPPIPQPSASRLISLNAETQDTGSRSSPPDGSAMLQARAEPSSAAEYSCKGSANTPAAVDMMPRGLLPHAVQESKVNHKGLQLVSQKGRRAVKSEPPGLQRPMISRQMQKPRSSMATQVSNQHKSKAFGSQQRAASREALSNAFSNRVRHQPKPPALVLADQPKVKLSTCVIIQVPVITCLPLRHSGNQGR